MEQNASKICNFDRVDNVNILLSWPDAENVIRKIVAGNPLSSDNDDSVTAGESALYEKIVYTSKRISPKKATALIKELDPANSLLTSITVGGTVSEGDYWHKGVFRLRSVYASGTRFVQLEATVGEIIVRGKASVDNWHSVSTLQNYVDAGRSTILAFFHVINRTGKICTVQFYCLAQGDTMPEIKQRHLDNEITPAAIGTFVADTMMKGIIHPDMQLCNIGCRGNGQIAFCDFADADIIRLPDELDGENLRRLTESLFPLIDGIKDYHSLSYLRAGFISNGGILARSVFLNARNNGFSSLSFVCDESPELSYDASGIFNAAPMIREWVSTELSAVTPKNYSTLASYNESDKRKGISPYNMYYLDQLYFFRSYMLFKSHSEALNDQIAVLMLNMAQSALCFNIPVTAYGISVKCLSSGSHIKSIPEMCRNVMKKSTSEGNIPDHITAFVAECAECHDLYEFLWILDDLDNKIPDGFIPNHR